MSRLSNTHRSFRAIETKETQDDDKQWLTYWVVFSLFHFVDEFFGFILEMIPFYYLLKVCFFIWMFLPTTLGALKIYHTVIHPLMEKYGDRLDNVVNSASDMASSVAKDA